MIGGLRLGTGAVDLKKAESCGHLRSGLAVCMVLGSGSCVDRGGSNVCRQGTRGPHISL